MRSQTAQTAEDILYGSIGARGLPDGFAPPITKATVVAALQDGTYWVNGKGEVVPLRMIDMNYAMNIRQMLRSRLQPEEYQNSPLWSALGRIRRRKTV